MAAIREADQIGRFQPTTLVSYKADIDGILDGGDPAALATLGMSPDGLAADDWREAMRRDGVAPTQRFAVRLAETGHAGLLVPSHARGAAPEHVDLVLWSWGENPPRHLLVADGEGRLGA